MKTVKSISSNWKIEINFIVYEKNDDGVLLICTVHGEGKSYQTNISVDFSELGEIIAMINDANHIDLYEIISSDLLASPSMITEVNLTSKLGKTVVLSGANQAA